MDPNTVALTLIQRWVGPDDKITDMSAFYDALVKALVDAHAEGEDEGEDEAATEEGTRRKPSARRMTSGRRAFPGPRF